MESARWRPAADALARAVSNRVTVSGPMTEARRADRDPEQLEIDALAEIVAFYEKGPNRRTADRLAAAVYQLITKGVIDARGCPGDEFDAYVRIRMDHEYDPIGAFARLTLRRRGAT